MVTGHNSMLGRWTLRTKTNTDDVTEGSQAKIHITAYQPHTELGGGRYAMSYVKEIGTSSDFDQMSENKRQCQNLESIDQCSARLLKQEAVDQCKCIPWSLVDIDSQNLLQCRIF